MLDHLVIASPHPAVARSELEELFGLPFVVGGKHPTEGTRNWIMRLGETAYLELLAIDPDNSQIAAPRWMGVDLVQQTQVVRWAMKSDQLAAQAKLLAQYRPDLGVVKTGSRVTTNGDILNWQLSMPAAAPTVELAPFLIDWQNSVHPAVGLAPALELVQFNLVHPQPETLQALFEQLGVPYQLQQGPRVSIEAKLSTPNGLVTLS